MELKPAFIVCIMGSHGCKSHEIQLDNLTTADLFRDIVYPMCEPLAFENPVSTIPRIFVVNACDTEPGYNGGKAIAKKWAAAPDLTESKSATNFLVGFSTLPSHPSIRYTGAGSCYLQSICRKFKKGVNIHAMLQEVRF